MRFRVCAATILLIGPAPAPAASPVEVRSPGGGFVARVEKP